MANLKHIRSQIKSVISIQKVTKAMKMVAAAKLRKSQERMEQSRPYSKRLENLIQHLLQDVNRSMLPLLNKRNAIQNHGFLIITADRGLAGSFNTNIIKKAESEINKVGKENAMLFCVGKKGFEHFKKREYNIIYHATDFWSTLNYNDAINTGKNIIDAYLNEQIDSLNAIYNFFKNTASQEVTYKTLLPLELESESQSQFNDMIYEPSKEDIIKSIVPKYFNTQIWQYLLESFASEQAARMVAMENANDNAKEMIDDLNLEFNKARQTAITTEMLEIVGGAEALSN